jgi:hypothetical protein
VGDIKNTDLVKVTPGQRLPGSSKEIPPGLYTTAELKQIAIDNKVSQSILDRWMQKLDEESIFNYATGGAVKMAAGGKVGYNPAVVDEIVNRVREKLNG